MISFSLLDFLYLVLSLCAITVTVVLTVAGVEAIRILKDVRRMADNVERMSHLAEQFASAFLPGLTRAAKGAVKVSKKVEEFMKRKSEAVDDILS